LINDIHSECPPKLKAILQECWQKDADQRPEMMDIVSRLKDTKVAPANPHYAAFKYY
jgi:hypothetical protein